MSVRVRFQPGLKPIIEKHQQHDQSSHGNWAGGGNLDTKTGLQVQAKQFNNFEDFSRAISLQGMRPRAWHITNKENFNPSKDVVPMSRTGEFSQESILFVGDPATWRDYASGRKVAVEYDLTNLKWEKDYAIDKSGNQGFYIKPNAYSKLKKVGEFSVDEAVSRASEQQKQMPQSKAEALSIYQNIKKHAMHDQQSHGNWAGGGWDKVFSESSIETKVNAFKEANPDATPQQISAFKSRTKKFFQNHDVVKKGNTLVTFQNKVDRNITGVDAEDRKAILEQVDFLQEKFPLERIYILAQDTSRRESRGGAAVKTAKGGTAIELNVLSIKFYHASSAGEDKLMPLETKDNAVDFTLAHEWGHAYANANPRAIMKVSNILKANPSLKNSLSSYAGKNENETFAEIFAQNAMEIKLNTPNTDVTSAVQEVLK